MSAIAIAPWSDLAFCIIAALLAATPAQAHNSITANIGTVNLYSIDHVLNAPTEFKMTDKHIAEQSKESNTEKDPSTWVTGDEPMTGAQKSYLKTLSEEAKVDFDASLTKAAASERIDELQEITGRGR